MVDRGRPRSLTTAQHSHARRSSRLTWVVALLAAAQTTAGVGVALARGHGSWAAPRHVGSVAAASSVPGPPSARSTSVTSSLPLTLEVPSVGIDTSLIRLRVAGDGSLEVPGSFGVAGWWADGAEPGAVGAAVIVGHVDSFTGPAVFYRLGKVKVGGTVRVTRADHSVVTFAIDGVRQYAKDQFPADEVYGATPSAALRLITCGGHFDRRRGEYDDNVVVFAHLVVTDDALPTNAPPA